MLIVPERSLVIVQPPRTASTSLRDAVLARYPKAFQPYRHMERDGAPAEFADWDFACVVRHPYNRLVSLYRFFRRMSSSTVPDVQATAKARTLAEDATRPFEEWLSQSREPLTSGHDADMRTRNPFYSTIDQNPVVRRPQARWARPDLGPVTLLRVENPLAIETFLDIALPHKNASDPLPDDGLPKPRRSTAVNAFLVAHHAWDLSLYERPEISAPPHETTARETTACETTGRELETA